MAIGSREFEIIVWGATGFTGKLTAEYLLGRYGTTDLRWALGGRNAEKLDAVRKELSVAAGIDPDSLPLVVGDSDDEAFLSEMVGRTEVVCTTVGPYAKYGTKLVAACARAGTHYCDLTGEVQWMQRMIDTYQDEAHASGARIVFTCGFDCIPADIGAYFMQREMKTRHGVAAAHIQFRVKAFKGAASGGTIASMLNMLEEAASDPGVVKAMRDPYALNPKAERQGPDSPEAVLPTYDSDFGQWTAPFVMATIDTKVVRRSNALLGYAYGREFRYDEAMLMGRGAAGIAKAAATAGGSAGMMGAMAVGPLRRMISGRLPQPGDGPSKAQREAGFFDIRLRAVHPDDPAKSLRGRILGDRDPGYGSTSKMLGESAVCLARDANPETSGCLTPAAAMGDALLARLPENAGVTFELEG